MTQIVLSFVWVEPKGWIWAFSREKSSWFHFSLVWGLHFWHIYEASPTVIENYAASFCIVVFHCDVTWGDKISGQGPPLGRRVHLCVRVSLRINNLLLVVSLVQILTSIALWGKKSRDELLLRWQEMLWLLNQCTWLKENWRFLMGLGHHSIIVIDKELVLYEARLMLKILFTLERVLMLGELLNWLPAWWSRVSRLRRKPSYWVRLRSISLIQPWIWCFLNEICATWCS